MFDFLLNIIIVSTQLNS